MQKRDFILIAALLLVCAGAAALLTPRERSAPLHAVVTQDGKQLYDIPLTGHRGTEEIVVADEHGTNTIRIEDETIAVVDADCPDLVCVKTGIAEKKGDVSASLPHKLLIEVK